MKPSAELARLKARALAAKAEAAQASAAAAQAALEAAELEQAESTDAPITDEAPVVDNAPATDEVAPAKADDVDVEPATKASAYAQEVHEGYATTQPTLTVGVMIDGEQPRPEITIDLPLSMLNRHGLVAGATGTGKTRTLQLLAEGLSTAGVPVFLTDIKGDLTGLLEPGKSSEKLEKRVAAQGQKWQPTSFPTELFTLGGQGNGTPIRTTVSDFGPILLAKVLKLNDTQESALSLIFHWADEEKLALVDLNDIRAVVSYLTSDDGKEELKNIGGIASSTAGVILRNIAELQAQDGDIFFGEPAFDVHDFIRQAADGRGIISSLELPDVQSRPLLFSTFLMWLLAELFEVLPERGDADKPKLIFFFDEAHLLFDDASKEFTDLVIRTVRLIRSKGVGIFFVTQSPQDIPADVLAQLGAKIQHALRAHTPNDLKDLRATVKTFPTSPLDLAEVLPNLGTGEALVTILDEKGRPSPVAPTRLWAPAANMGVADAQTIKQSIADSPLYAKYETSVDPESAYELLNARIAAQAEQAQADAAAEAQRAENERLTKELEKQAAAAQRQQEREAARAQRRQQSMFDSVLKTAGRSLVREITRGLFGNHRR